MESNKSDLIELSEKILRGIKEASLKLMEKNASNGRSLVVFMDGEIKKVPAKDLLSKFYPNK